MNHLKKIISVIVIFAIVFWVFYSFYKRKQLQQHYSYVTGLITGITGKTYKNNNHSILYDYQVGGKIYHASNDISVCEKMSLDTLRLILVNNTYTVAFDTADVAHSIIIIDEKTAVRFNRTVSDSIKKIDSLIYCK